MRKSALGFGALSIFLVFAIYKMAGGGEIPIVDDNIVDSCFCEIVDQPVLPAPYETLNVAKENVEDYAEFWNSIDSSLGVPIHENTDSENNQSECFKPTCAYTFSAEEMILAFGMHVDNGKVKAHRRFTRAYIGVEHKPGHQDERVHLYFVPLEAENGNWADKPFICDGIEYVLDLTTPCPNTCDPGGKLFKAFNDKLESCRKLNSIPLTTPPTSASYPSCVGE